MENITRRNCLKLIGSLSGMMLLSTITGCKKRKNENNIEYDENEIKNIYWEATGNSKEFEPNEHFIYSIISIAYKENGQINIPEGYEYISSETITEPAGYGSETLSIKYNFVNTVPVTALEYKNSETNETAYPFAGTPITLENTNSKQKNMN